MGKAGGLWIRAWWEMGEEGLLLGMMWSVSASLSLCFCRCLSSPLTVVTLSMYVSHIFSVFHIQHGVYVWLKRSCKFNPLIGFRETIPFRRHFPPIRLVSPSHPKPGTHSVNSVPSPKAVPPLPHSGCLPGHLSSCFPSGFRISANNEILIPHNKRR